MVERSELGETTSIGLTNLIAAGITGILKITLGHSPPLANMFDQIAYDALPNLLPDPPTLINMRRRDIINNEKFLLGMRRQGYNENTVDAIMEATRFLPSAPELAHWAAREAFQSEYQKEFGGDEEYPPELAKLAQALGADYDPFGKEASLMTYFWRAHWVIPALTNGFEMLHRGIITEEELDSLFVANDIMPGWRSRLKQLSFNLPTRVDIRRMYRVGVIDRDKVLSFYKQTGYDDANAEALTLFTEITEGEEFTNLTRTQILNGFKEGVLTEEQTREMLSSIDFNPSDIDFYIAQAELDVQQDRETQELKNITRSFRIGITDETELVTQLSGLALDAGRQEIILTEERLRKESNINRPPRGTVINWFKLGMIDVDEFTRRMDDLGIKGADVELYITEVEDKTAGSVRQPSVKDMLGWYSNGYLGLGALEDRLSAAGYQRWAIDAYIANTQVDL